MCIWSDRHKCMWFLALKQWETHWELLFRAADCLKHSTNISLSVTLMWCFEQEDDFISPHCVAIMPSVNCLWTSDDFFSAVVIRAASCVFHQINCVHLLHAWVRMGSKIIVRPKACEEHTLFCTINCLMFQSLLRVLILLLILKI